MYPVASGDLLSLAYASVIAVFGVLLVTTRFWIRSVAGHGAGAIGLALTLHGLRALGAVDAVALAVGVPSAALDYFGPLCFYALTIPEFVAIERLWGPGWRSSLSRVRQVAVVVLFGAAAFDLVFAPGSALPLSVVLVFGSRLVLLVNLVGGHLRIQPTDRVAVGGLVLLLVSAVYDPFALWLGFARLQPADVGTVVFLLALVAAVILRGQVREQRLVALEQELTIAGQLQKALLPPSADRPTSCASFITYLPMHEVGGDLYDFVPLGRNRFGVLVVDVTGHGVPAALVASAVKMAVVAERSHAHDPSAFVEALNRRLFEPLDSTLVTAVYACVDPDAGAARLVRAGHPPPLLYSSATGCAVPVGLVGVALGLLPDSTYDETALSFAPGDRFVLYSDGVTEAASPSGQMFGVDRVCQHLLSGAVLPLDRCIDAMLNALDDYQHQTVRRCYEDDVTIVALEMPSASKPAD